MKYNEWGIIRKHTARSAEIFEMEISLPRSGRFYRPGQFLHLRIGTGVDPLLRRPFSVYRIRGRARSACVHILYRNVGKGTALLSSLREGSEIDVLGPLGNGFTLPDRHASGSAIILVAGGMGIAPLLYLAETILSSAERKKRPPVMAYMGTDTARNVMAAPVLKKMGCRVKTATDDGSDGFHGYVTDCLRNDIPLLRRYPGLRIYACGPLPMLLALQRICHREHWQGQVSVDEMMGCGVGACLGCVIRTREASGAFSNQRICHDGPVFDMYAIAPEQP